MMAGMVTATPTGGDHPLILPPFAPAVQRGKRQAQPFPFQTWEIRSMTMTRRRMFTLVAGSALALTTATAFAATLAEVQKKGTLVVATEDEARLLVDAHRRGEITLIGGATQRLGGAA